MPRRTLTLLGCAAGLVLSACGEAAGPVASTSPPVSSDVGWPQHQPPPPEPGFDPDDPANDLLADSLESDARLVKLLGRRADFRVHRSPLAGLLDGPLAHAVIAPAWAELELPDPRYRRLNAGQRALFALQWADAEILNGGFDQFWFNDTGFVGAELATAARRVGAPEYEAVFRAADALFPGGRTPRSRAARERLIDTFDQAAVTSLDERYAAFQYRRRTSLGLILGDYVRAHLGEFVVD